MAFGPVPGPIHSGDASDSKLIFLGSEKGGNDLSIALGSANRNVQIKGDGVLLDSKDTLDGLKTTGSALEAWSHGLTSPMLTGEMILGGGGLGTIFVVMLHIPEDTTLTGAAWFQTVQGNYTSANYNGFGFYQYDGTQYSRMDYTPSDTAIWKAAAGATYKKDFNAPIAVTPGNYWLMMIFEASVVTTAPRIAAAPNAIHAGIANLDSQTDIKTYQGDNVANGNPTPPSIFGSYTSEVRHPWLAVY